MENLLKKSIKKYQETQDLAYGVQKISNKIRSKSKKAIALLRRDNVQESKKEILEVESLFRLINKIIKKNKGLANQSFYKEAVEEFIEAITFYNFVDKLQGSASRAKHGSYNFLTKSKKEIPDFVEAGVEEIISGFCDFTGELVRRAVTEASPENLSKLILYKKTIENIVEELTKIGFRGKLRQKYDEVERNLRKIEDILYDIKLKI